mmetsp:Transcript_34610/g.80223  ORF Transcript_34610/g.80223 Transcript_34610/m.80223 type:complete len:207 (+) Transcript_34610:770-1390(+)
MWALKHDAPGAADELAALRDAWAEVMGAAVDEPKRQPESFGSVEALFNGCDLLNELLLVKLRAIYEAHGGVFHRANVKSEDRALQKVYRSYGGDWRRLTDLNRCALAFGSFGQIAACLRVIGAHPEIMLLKTSQGKMRFDDEYDASKSGRYRDVQISVRIDTAWTREHGLDKVLCEVQLHHAEFYERKTKGGGHPAYVTQRDMRGR